MAQLCSIEGEKGSGLPLALHQTKCSVADFDEGIRCAGPAVESPIGQSEREVAGRRQCGFSSAAESCVLCHKRTCEWTGHMQGTERRGDHGVALAFCTKHDSSSASSVSSLLCATVGQ